MTPGESPSPEFEASSRARGRGVTSLGAPAYRVEGCGPPETFVCVSYQGWVCTREGGPQSSQRVLQTVGAVARRKAEDEAQEFALQQALQQQTTPVPVIDTAASRPPSF